MEAARLLEDMALPRGRAVPARAPSAAMARADRQGVIHHEGAAASVVERLAAVAAVLPMVAAVQRHTAEAGDTGNRNPAGEL